MRITADTLAQMPLEHICKVTFYKRDEVTTDLICCDVEDSAQTWTFHEEADGGSELIAYLSDLPDFRQDWFGAVSQPPFAPNMTVAFERG